MEERFHRLLVAHGPALLRLAASYVSVAGDRDDLFQEIAVAIWKALPRFRGESSERTFIFRIAHNRAISHIAKQRLSALPVEGIDVPDPGLSPETNLIRKESQDRLLAAIRQLPLEYRQVITLDLEGLSRADMAQVAGITESNVGVRLNRARHMLRRLLEGTT